MKSLAVKNIRLGERPGLIKLANPKSCSHEWEYHLWEDGAAYCPRCGSNAEIDDDHRTKAMP